MRSFLAIFSIAIYIIWIIHVYTFLCQELWCVPLPLLATHQHPLKWSSGSTSHFRRAGAGWHHSNVISSMSRSKNTMLVLVIGGGPGLYRSVVSCLCHWGTARMFTHHCNVCILYIRAQISVPALQRSSKTGRNTRTKSPSTTLIPTDKKMIHRLFLR